MDVEDAGGSGSVRNVRKKRTVPGGSTTSTASTGRRLKSFAAFLHPQSHRAGSSSPSNTPASGITSHTVSSSSRLPLFPSSPRASTSSDGGPSDLSDPDADLEEDDSLQFVDRSRRRRSANSTVTCYTVGSSELGRTESPRSTARAGRSKQSSQTTLTDLGRHDSRDEVANSRRISFPKPPLLSAISKGKRPSKGADDEEDFDAEEERYSRRGSDFEGSERGRRSSDLPELREGSASDSISEEDPTSSESGEDDEASESEEEVAARRPPRLQPERSVPSAPRSRSCSAPSTPRPPGFAALAPVSPTGSRLTINRVSPPRSVVQPSRPTAEAQPTFRAARAQTQSDGERRRAGQRSLEAAASSTSAATPLAPVSASAPSRSFARRPTAVSVATSTPSDSCGLPAFASLIRPANARLVESRALEPSYWSAVKDFTLGPYPAPRSVDSSGHHHHHHFQSVMPTRSQTMPISSSSGLSRVSGYAASSAQAYGGSAGGFGPGSVGAGGTGMAATGSSTGSGPGLNSSAGSTSATGAAAVHGPVGTPLAAGHSGIEILLDSPDLVLRSMAGNEGSGDPAILSGEVQLTLTDPTSIKDVQLVLRGFAKIDFQDHHNRRHHAEHPLFYHDESFLPAQADPAHHRSHTLQGCVHRFPFSISLPTTLPASLRTYTGTGLILYKLKATATKGGGGFGSLLSGGGKWEAKRLLRVARSFEGEAVEWSQTLEIDNTWPGKISYNITLPHKAFAAGDAIPVSLKFTPLMKGVRVVALVTAIKETVALQGKHGHSHQENRDVLTTRHEFVRPQSASGSESRGSSSAGPSTGEPSLSRNLSHSDMNILASRLQAVQTGSNPRFPAGMLRRSPNNSRPFTPRSEPNEALASGDPAYFGQGINGETLDTATLHEIAADVSLSEDIETIIDVHIPSWTTPTHPLTPIQVSHKIKWSAFIKNPDGHISELRCALPIHILAPHLSEEARLASSGVRNLLFGPSGALAPSDFQQADLPSYSEHVRDRVAPLDTASVYPVPSGFVQAPWWSMLESAVHTPAHSPPPSRPPSPSRTVMGGQRHYINPESTTPSHRPPPQAGRSGTQTPAYGTALHDGAFVNWADAELLRSLEDDEAVQRPPMACGDSSQSSSRSHSAPNSRPPSPPPAASPSPPGTADAQGPPPSQQQQAHHGFFNLHLPKPLRALTPMSRSPVSPTPPNPLNGAGPPHHASLHARLAGIAQSSSGSGQALGGTRSANASTTDLSHLMPGGLGAEGGGSGGSSGDPSVASSPVHAPATDRDLDAISRVPSYNVASRGALGGGPVPLSSFAGLPSYDESSAAYSQSSTSSLPAPVSTSAPASTSTSMAMTRDDSQPTPRL